MNEIKYNKGVATISALVEKYRKSGRFTEEMAQSVTNALEGKELNIAVIGKMKAGKSSFTNALIFKGNVLPSGPEPTTVTLTDIVYTDDPLKDSKVKVELLTHSDITDLQTNAKSENAQISQNASALLERINRIPGGYEQYVNKEEVEIDLDKLTEFTSTEGRYSGLAKKVTIYKHLDVLKGLKITDTPGFNDPVKSRGETTKNALKDSHIILFIHDYLDKYDEDEIAILQDQVEYSGVSMLVDIINKVDMQEGITQWSSCIQKFDRKKEEAIKQISKEGVKELLKKGRISYVSALMALIGYEVLEYNQKREGDISNDIKVFFNEYQNDFPELRSADDFINYSNITDIVDIINQLSADKSKYLASYPIQTLIGLLKSLVNIISAEINGKRNELVVLKQNAEEARRQLDAVNGMFEALRGRINGPDLSITLNEKISETKSEIQREREDISEKEFNTSNYEKEGNIFTSGPENRNLSRYKGVLADFDNSIRNKLEGLKNKFRTECEAYINNLVLNLVAHNITLADRQNFANVLINQLKSEISSALPIAVDPDEPTECLYGAGEQYALYKSDFRERRRDTVIDGKYLKIFSDFANNQESYDALRDAITDQIEALKAKLKGAIDYSPIEKEKEVEKLVQEVNELEDECEGVERDIESLEELKNA